jgi:excisionase family DNA binding protein
MTTTEQTADLLTLREVAATLHVSYGTAWNLTTRGELPSIRIGTRPRRGQMIRVSRDDLVAYLAEVNR